MQNADGFYAADAFFPPGYPVLLSLGGLGKMDRCRGRGGLMQFSSRQSFACCFLLYRLTGTAFRDNRGGFGDCGSLIFCKSMPRSFRTGFYFFGVTAWPCCNFISKTHAVALAAAGAAAGLAWADALFGHAWIAAGMGDFLDFSSRWISALKEAIAFGLISALPMLPWAWHTRFGRGLFGRNYHLHLSALKVQSANRCKHGLFLGHSRFYSPASCR